MAPVLSANPAWNGDEPCPECADPIKYHTEKGCAAARCLCKKKRSELNSTKKTKK